MTLRLWLQILAIIVITSIPLAVLQGLQSRDAMKLVLATQPTDTLVPLLGEQMENLRRLAELDREREESYRSQFEKLGTAQRDLKDLQQVETVLLADLWWQILRNILVVSTLGLLLALIISKRIVKRYEELMADRVRLGIVEEQSRTLQSWQRMAKTLVHELRAPIAPIHTVSEALTERFPAGTPSAAFVEECSEILRSQVQRVEQMIASFTRFARLPEARKQRLELASVIGAFQENNRGFWPKNFSLAVSGPDTPEACLVDADPDLLHALFFNLVRNALEAAGDGSLTVTIAIRKRSGQAEVLISNDGPPISEAQAAHLFSLSRTSGKSENKLGLGLLICRKIALDHGGELSVVSNAPVVFRLTLPLGAT